MLLDWAWSASRTQIALHQCRCTDTNACSDSSECPTKPFLCLWNSSLCLFPSAGITNTAWSARYKHKHGEYSWVRCVFSHGMSQIPQGPQQITKTAQFPRSKHFHKRNLRSLKAMTIYVTDLSVSLGWHTVLNDNTIKHDVAHLTHLYMCWKDDVWNGLL